MALTLTVQLEASTAISDLAFSTPSLITLKESSSFNVQFSSTVFKVNEAKMAANCTTLYAA
ncbi:hypothetical protein CVT26_007330 [Gymnopilus dilepis]|uniref:Uncharacterized protein n=1 Tax=Gymnopilus dilepis TaxID=231916 RepID=A0A409W1J1_9AGAR|nr:hypothetical protein CVT26_007330 [Gymnopilus dilepis]